MEMITTVKIYPSILDRKTDDKHSSSFNFSYLFFSFLRKINTEISHALMLQHASIKICEHVRQYKCNKKKKKTSSKINFNEIIHFF